MKKLNIPSQLLLLFFTIILVASCAFYVIALTRIQVIAEDEVYSRLSTYVYLINNKGEEKLPDMNIGYYIKEPNYSETYKSPTLSNYITEDDLVELIQRIKEDNLSQEFPRKSFLANGYIKNAQKKIYYVVSTEDNLENYTIIFTDNKYTDSMVKNVALQVILLFFLLILVSIYVIYLWSSKLVKRIKMIQNHILNLPRDKYAISYVDDSLDEVGDLSKSIEKMRQEIEKNENTKQEMLQNLSHDFKTPIAVIKSYAEAFQDKVVDENEASKIIISQAEILKKKVN
ncbi:TPA: HAMP domain-containing histidine kinase, partial [Candidatus Avacholeplasma faecigallinarum]|nr:HAMP domain-containing histidine kinase [Candidatus Avacholeplasma faecigallinarum]